MHAAHLMTIGEFASASGLSPKALRMYDESGLLVPADVDPVTGYRRYAADQLDRARLVARLRLAGVPLARIRLVADLPAPAAAAELTSYWRQVQADTASAGALVADLVAALTTKEQPMSTTHPHPQPHPQVAAASYVEQGGRDTQQDAALVADGFFAVADGFGEVVGLGDAVLAELAAHVSGADPVAGLDAAVGRAVSLLAERYADRPDAGCTLTALVLGDRQAVLAHVGDSRAYLVRQGRLSRLTRDHTVVQTLVDEGRLTPEEAGSDERRVQLNRALSVGTAYLPDLAVHALEPGDRVVLSTDGVHRPLDPAALTDLLVADVGVDEVVATVRTAVEAAGADDNHALVVVDLA